MARSVTSFKYDDNGKSRKGTYFVSGGKNPLITVNTEFGKKAAQLGSLRAFSDQKASYPAAAK